MTLLPLLSTFRHGVGVLLNDFLHAQDILFDVTAKDVADCLGQVVAHLHSRGRVQQPEAVLRSLLERERVRGTGISRGLALPHARIADISQAVIAAVRLHTELNFGAVDGIPTRHVICILTPKSLDPSEHVAMLSTITSWYSQGGNQYLLDSAQSPQAYKEILGR